MFITKIQKAAWALSNATTNGSVQDIGHLVNLGLLELFVELLDL
jgi:hypothetical protein